MGYRVIEYFTDLQDNNYAYNVGDTFPHVGMEVSPSRIAELAGSNNKRKMPLIERVADETPVESVDESIDESIDESVDESVDEKPVKAEPKKRRSKKNG